MFNLVEYGLGKMMVGISELGDTLTSFSFDKLEEEPELKPETIEIKEVEPIEVVPYVKKMDYLTHLDKYFSYKEKAAGIKYYLLDKIKTCNFDYYEITGFIHDRRDDKVSIKLDKNYNIVESKCSCKKPFCKHAYALVLKYYDEYLHNNKKIYYMFKTKYLLTQFKKLYDLIIENVELNDDLKPRISCYEKMINNYLEVEPSEYNYNEIYNHYCNLKETLYKINKETYSDILLKVEFIDYDICSSFYKELVNEDYIEDVLLDTIDEM